MNADVEAMPDRDESTTGWLDPVAVTPPEPRGADAPATGAALASPGWLERNLPLSLDAYEKAVLERALVETWGDASEAARLLGIGRSTFYRKAGKHGINLAEVRSPSGSAREEPRESADPVHGVGAPKTLG